MKRVLLIVLLVFNAGCTSWDYRIEGKKVVFGTRSWNHAPLDYEVRGADTATFRVLKDGYARDRTQVYLKGDVIAGADPVSFEILKDGYTRDKNHVFLSKCSLDGADPQTWRLIAEYWSRDAKRVFQGYSVIPGTKPDTFRYIKDGWAIDGARAYHHLALFPEDCSQPNQFLRLTVFDDVDPSTFEVIDGFHAKDARQHFDALKTGR